MASNVVSSSYDGQVFALPEMGEQEKNLNETKYVYRTLDNAVQRAINNYERSSTKQGISLSNDYELARHEKTMLDIADWADRSLVDLTTKTIQNRQIHSTKWLQMQEVKKIDPNLSDADNQFYSFVSRLKDPQLFDWVYRAVGDQLFPELSELVSEYGIEKSLT